MTAVVTDQSQLARRLAAQMLSGEPASHPVAVVERLLAVQGQDLQGSRLAIRARSRDLTVIDVDRCLTQNRSLLITTLNRGTLHLVRSQDYPWLHALTAPLIVPNKTRRLGQEHVSPAQADAGVALIERALVNCGPRTRTQLKEMLAAADIPTAGQAFVHILMCASLRGVTVRGPMLGSEHAFVLVREWLPKPPRVHREHALAELARRYLAGHGPATDRDLARWSGLPLRDARVGLTAIAKELVQLSGGVVDLAGRAPMTGLPPPRLLGQFDPVLLGWVSREPIVGEYRELVTVNGLFRPFAMVRGRAAGLWSRAGGTVRITPFTTLLRADRKALDADAADVRRFMSSEIASADRLSPEASWKPPLCAVRRTRAPGG